MFSSSSMRSVWALQIDLNAFAKAFCVVTSDSRSSRASLIPMYVSSKKFFSRLSSGSTL